jgi:hypothetical protein
MMYRCKEGYTAAVPAGITSKCIPNSLAVFLICINVCMGILVSGFGPFFYPGRTDMSSSFIAISGPIVFVMCRNQIVHDSASFLPLDRINLWAPLVMHRSGARPIPLLEVIDKTGGTIEFRDFFRITALSQKCLAGNIAQDLLTKNGLGSNHC